MSGEVCPERVKDAWKSSVQAGTRGSGRGSGAHREAKSGFELLAAVSRGGDPRPRRRLSAKCLAPIQASDPSFQDPMFPFPETVTHLPVPHPPPIPRALSRHDVNESAGYDNHLSHGFAFEEPPGSFGR